MLGSNGRKALLFFDLSRQGIQVEKILLLGSAEESLRKEESRRLLEQAEQYFDSMLSIETEVVYSRRVYCTGARDFANLSEPIKRLQVDQSEGANLANEKPQKHVMKTIFPGELGHVQAGRGSECRKAPQASL